MIVNYHFAIGNPRVVPQGTLQPKLNHVATLVGAVCVGGIVGGSQWLCTQSHVVLAPPNKQ